jgi:hypothetical protein
MSDERLRPELISLFRQGTKPGKPKVTLTDEQFESLISRLQSLKEEIEANNEKLKEALKERD